MSKTAIDINKLNEEELRSLAEKQMAQLENVQKQNVELENLANQAKEKAKQAVGDKEAAEKALLKEQAKIKDLETIRKETAKVTAAQIKYFGETFEAVVKNNAKVVHEGKEIEVGFLPGIHKIRIPGFNHKYAVRKDKAGNVIDKIPFMEDQRGILIDRLIEFYPSKIQELWDKKVDIFKNLETGDAYFGKNEQLSLDIDVVE